MNKDELAVHIEGFMSTVPGEDQRPWDSVQMADYLLPKIQQKQIIPVVAAVITVGTKFLLHRKNESRNPELLGKWEFPGGMMEYGETPEMTLLRELKEELGWVSISVSRLFHAKTFIPKSQEHYLVLFYEATIPTNTPIPGDCALFLREEIPYADCLGEVKEIIDAYYQK